ncbi:pilus assembly protein PilY [Pseudomonas solani]|uniref:pilus assembly protein PilY n=1 Tax=Pseudomonas solani TaxID=2731552 RepID=UPI003C3067D5
MSIKRQLAIGASAFAYLSLSLSTALADDTEIYTTRELPADQRVRPNILFVIDTSGSMQSGVPGTNCNSLTPIDRTSDGIPRDWCTSTEARSNRTNTGQLTRIQVVKEVVNQLVDELALSNDSNIGLVRFSSDNEGGFVNVPVQQAGTVANTFKTQLNSYYASGSTPLLETYHEAAQYMRGAALVYGNSSRGVIENGKNASTRNPWNSATASYSGSSYLSPIQNSCQKSNIIVLTDGLPNDDSSSNSAIQSLTRTGTANTNYTSCNRGYPTDGEANAGCWMPGLAEWLANNDNGPASVTGKQTISTYTIGFGNISDTRLLADTATLGQGKFFTTNDTSGLVTSLKSIIVDILAENTTFTTPTVSVSAYSNFGYRNDLYYALFRPAKGARWLGNIKKYKATSDSSGNLVVTDANGNNAVDSTTGFFADSAQSYWSASADGKNAGLGGAASRLSSPSTRNLYTYTGNNLEPGNTTPVNLTGSAHLLVNSNTALTKTLLGDASMTDAYKSNLLTWARGTNPADNAIRSQIADVLHNAPKVVAYTSDEDITRISDGTTQDKLALFYGTNEGFIGAINPANGNELFSFIPKELLGNLKPYYDDPQGSTNKKYGIDGQFDLKVTYGSRNATTNLRPVSAVTLYAGMGRGGRNYYSLDMTPSTAGDPATIQPKLKWVIRGGASGSTGFSRLGQTWSTPKVAKIKWNGTVTDVLIFTGGYDVNQDNDATPDDPKSDTYGNALYVVNANTGQKLWMAGPTGDADANLTLATMTNSMPSDPALVDLGGDGLIDAIFTSDTRGQIFRFDIKQNNAGASDFATGGRIANIGGTDAVNNRRFYNQPDVALIKERGGESYFTIGIGSGYRGHPLSESALDRFYVIRDKNVYTAPATYTSITESNLVDVSSVNLTSAQAQAIQTQINTKRAEIDALTAAETNARNALTAYQTSIGYTTKLNALVETNTTINQKQSAIDTILRNDPYVKAHAGETDSRTQSHSLVVSAQSALAQLNAQTASTANASSFKAAELDNAQGTDVGALQAKITAALNDSNLSSQYAAIIAKQNQITATKAAGGDASAQESDLSTMTEAYESSAAYQTRQTLITNLSGINDKVTQIAALQAQIIAAYNLGTPAGDSDAASKLSQLNAAKTALSSLLPSGLPAVPAGTTNSDLIARTETQNQTDLETISSPLVTQANLLTSLESERLALAGQASTLQSELQTLANRAYSASSNLLNATQLAEATTLDPTPPLTQFDAYNYLISKAQAAAVAGIPTKRQEINTLYAQLTPGDSYTPNPTLLAASSGWFIRFPSGEKVLSSSTSFAGSVLFTTFRPSGQQTTTCGPDVGRGRFYALNLIDASAVFAQTVNGTKTPIRSFDLAHGGIPPKPATILRDDNSVGLLCGAENCTPQPTQCVDGAQICETNKAIRDLYWREN